MNRKRQADAHKKKLEKKKKVISLDVKLDVLRRFEAGEKVAHIARALSLPPTTVRSICTRDATNIKQLSEVATDSQIKNTVMNRSALIVKMESLLLAWIERQTQKSLPLSKNAIQAEAKSIYENLRENLPLSKDATDEHFAASRGWFERFKVRANLHDIYLKGKAGFASMLYSQEDIDTTTRDPFEKVECAPADSDSNSSDVPDEKILSNDIDKAMDLISEAVEIFLNNDPDTDRSARVAEAVKSEISCYGKLLTSKDISKALKLISDGVEILLNGDPDTDRSAKVAEQVKSSISVYEKLYLEKKGMAGQMTLDKYFQKESKEKQAENKGYKLNSD